LAIEAEHKAFPNMPQRDLAKRLGVSKTKVGLALRIMPKLEDYHRELITDNLDKNCKEDGNLAPPRGKNSDEEDELDPPQVNPKPGYQITESVLGALAVLEDIDEVGDTLEILMFHRTPEAEAKRCIEYVKNGEGGANNFFFDKFQSKNKGEDPYAEDWKGLNPAIKVKHKGGEDYEVKLTVTGGQKAFEIVHEAQRTLEGGLAGKLARFLKDASKS
jgi:hypothetical protein